MQDWMRDELMPRLASLIRREVEPQGTDAARFLQSAAYGYHSIPDPVVDSEFEVTEIRPRQEEPHAAE